MSNKSQLKVLVITIVYNGVFTIEECIRSVKRQDYPNMVHRVIDGGSSDGTLQVLKQYKVDYLTESDGGIYDAFNKGIYQSTEFDIVHFLNADDCFIDSQVVSSVVNLFEKTQCDLVHGLIDLVDENGVVVKTLGKNLNAKQLMNKMRVAHPSVFVKQSIYQKYGGFSVGFKVAGDYEFLLRIWNKVAISFVPKVFVKMRLGGVSSTHYKLSYKESMVAAILNGKPIIPALFRYYFELIKYRVEALFKIERS